MTAKLDRNAAFKAEREQQISALLDGRKGAEERAAAFAASTKARIESGKLVPIGGNAYRVNEPGSWDDGEVWTLRQPRGADKPLILPVSNLDESRGKAALYTTAPEWHGLGNVVPAGVTDLAEVLRLGGIDFEVTKIPAQFARPPHTRDGKKVPAGLGTVPGGFVNVRTDLWAPLGMVGKVYTNIQTYDAGRFLQELVDNHGVTFASAGALYGGRKVFIGMKLPDNVVLDLGDGVADEIDQFLYWLNSFDGWSSATAIVTPWRVACGNTERFALRDAGARWRTRHTTKALSEENVAEARRVLGLTLKYAKSFKAEEEALARTNMEIAEFDKIVKGIFPVAKDASTLARRIGDERRGMLLGQYVKEADKLGKTAYAAERTFTHYIDYRPRRGPDDGLAAARATAIIEGTDDDLKSKVHQKLMLKVR